MNKLPLVSIVTATLNAEKHLQTFFRSLARQDYPKDKIEIVMADGGSTDKTIEIAEKYGVKIIDNPHVLAEPGIYTAMKNAKGDIFVIMAMDNFFVQKDAIRNLVKILSDDKIYSVFPKHISEKNDSLWTKYFNVFTDPFNHYLYGKAANARTFNKIYKTIEHNEKYDIYDYTSYPVKPLIALAQGFSVKKEYIKRRGDKFDDMISIIELINQRKKIAYAHSIHLHHKTVVNLGHFIKKIRWATRNAISKKNYGIWERRINLTNWQKLKIIIFPLYVASIIIPLFRALFGLLEDREPMWLFHPFITTVALIIMIYEAINVKLAIIKNK
ncbi:MAG: Glycosyl transferase GT2 family [Candidatus Roizmanbacteria bacterium GW2011_GWA2_36_23]|uniref:Glycosyl transferase GT2 family n=1 Tax=Candidatus Roizmanbacteria bacterium GW2011_GWA2_36_23 TaxID=1618480 RepID=A0A0G0E4E5_9BACT|nr:MAG: Glycosyl transferase GT2 family [Candidatus Roizmanbacteria bacterium GW2011_GWA2_36_23]